jgi:prenyltransferase beta subunit
MRFAFPLLLLLPTVSFAQTKEMVDAIERKRERQRTAKWVLEQEAPAGGFLNAPQDPKVDAAPRASLRATNGAVRALKYLGFPLLKGEKEKHAKFVLSCYDPKTGAFAEPGGKPDVTITSIGVMAAAELDIPHEKYARAMDYLKENAKSFEEVRIGAAAVEAWGVKACPFKLDDWFKIATKHIDDANLDGSAPQSRDGGARELGSFIALVLRLDLLPPDKVGIPGTTMKDGQRNDGGWGKKGAKSSDIETTYRVMRALMLMKMKPKDVAKLRAYLASHHNKDGGYGVKPGDQSSMSGVYFASIVTMWLDEMEKK